MTTPPKKDDASKGLTPVTIAAALLAAAGLFALVQHFVQGGVFESKEGLARRDIAAVMTGLRAYRAQFGGYPSTDEGLEVVVERGLLPKAPVDPWGHPYLYSSSQGRISVITFGVDGVSGGGDDVVEFHPSGGP